MSKDLTPLVGASEMHRRATLATSHSNYAVLQNRYVEEHFSIKITDLLGRSMKPLAGFTVTFSEILPHSQIRESQVDDILQFGYVEYGTGYRLWVYLKVELDEDYLPLGVELKALEDAVMVQTESILNTCGYTFNETPLMGLRSVDGVQKNTSTAFNRLFEIDSFAKRFLDTAFAEGTIPTFSETEDEFIFSADVPAVLVGGGLLIHRSALGRLVELVDRKVYISKEDEDVAFELDYLKELKKWDFSIDIQSLELEPDGRAAHTTVPVTIEGLHVSVKQPRDWKTPRDRGGIVLDKPDDWFFVIGQEHTKRYSGIGVASYINFDNLHITPAMVKRINFELPRLLSAPRANVKEEPQPSTPRRTFRRWVSDGIRTVADWFDNN